MKLNDYKNITKFLKDNPDVCFKISEVGFGRPCVGILHGDHYLSYEIYDHDTYNIIAEHVVASSSAPENAYHKGPYLSVLMHPVDNDLGPSDADKSSALEELDGWLGAIIKEGYKIQEYLEGPNTFNAVFGKRKMLKAVVDK